MRKLILAATAALLATPALAMGDDGPAKLEATTTAAAPVRLMAQATIKPPPLPVPRLASSAVAPSADAMGADASAVAPMPGNLPQQIPPESDSGSAAPPPGAEVLDVRATPD